MDEMDEIRQLEEAFAQLLPAARLEGRPGAELLAAGDRWSRTIWAAAEEAGPYPIADQDRARGLRLAHRPIFVCGTHRSGTSLMRDLCDGHPQLIVLPSEGSFFTSMEVKIAKLPPAERPGFVSREWLRRLANPSNQPPFWLLGRTTVHHSPYLLFARQFMAWWSILEDELGSHISLRPLVAVVLAYAGCLRGPGINAGPIKWLEKTPTNERYLDRLWAEFPAAQVVQLVRHPFSIYASRKALEEKIWGEVHSPRRVLRDLADSFRVAAGYRSVRQSDKYLLVRYEDLVAAPEKVMDQLADFLQIEPNLSLLAPTVANRPAFANSSFHRDINTPSILPLAESERHSYLTERERRLVAAYAGDFALALGYRLKRLHPILRMWLKAQLGLQAGWLAVLA